MCQTCGLSQASEKYQRLLVLHQRATRFWIGVISSGLRMEPLSGRQIKAPEIVKSPIHTGAPKHPHNIVENYRTMAVTGSWYTATFRHSRHRGSTLGQTVFPAQVKLHQTFVQIYSFVIDDTCKNKIWVIPGNRTEMKALLLSTISSHLLHTTLQLSKSEYGGNLPKINSRISSGRSLMLLMTAEFCTTTTISRQFGLNFDLHWF